MTEVNEEFLLRIETQLNDKDGPWGYECSRISDEDINLMIKKIRDLEDELDSIYYNKAYGNE